MEIPTSSVEVVEFLTWLAGPGAAIVAAWLYARARAGIGEAAGGVLDTIHAQEWVVPFVAAIIGLIASYALRGLAQLPPIGAAVADANLPLVAQLLAGWIGAKAAIRVAQRKRGALAPQEN